MALQLFDGIINLQTIILFYAIISKKKLMFEYLAIDMVQIRSTIFVCILIFIKFATDFQINAKC